MSEVVDIAGPASTSASAPAQSWWGASQQWLTALLRRGTWVVIGAALVVVMFRVVAAFDLGVLWDDAYIFQRYALNLRNGDGWAWQPGGEPTYGTTSLAFVLPVWLLQVLTDNVAASALLASVTGGIAFLVVMFLTLRAVRASKAVLAIGAVSFFACAAWSALPEHFVTGMDTSWALVYVAAFLWSLQRLERSPSRRRALWLGLLGGLSFAVRPDLMAFTVFIPAAWSLLTPDKALRRWLWQALALMVTLTAALLAFNAWYFQSALPLPFYAKSMRIYGDSMRWVYRGVSSENLLHFISGCWPLVIILLLDLLAGPRNWWKRAAPLDKATLFAALFFGAYYWMVALPVMSMAQRFLQPLLPVFAWLAVRIAARWEREHAAAASIGAAGRWGLSLAAGFGLLMVLFMLSPHATKHGTAFVRRVAKRGLHLDIHKHSAGKGPRSYWYKIDAVSALPDDVVLATTEVGFLGVLNPNKRIIDMAGLNERAFAHRPFDADTLLVEQHPDFIYMPHLDYKTMREAIIRSDAFAGYEFFTYKRLRTRNFGVAIRRDSPHYREIRALLPRSVAPPKFKGRGKGRRGAFRMPGVGKLDVTSSAEPG